MEYNIYKCHICYQQEIAPDIVACQVRNLELAKKAKAGQFLHVQCGDVTSMPLRRPISICDVNEDCITFIYEIKGRGTKALQEQAGELDILGPLGNGFAVEKTLYHHPAVIGGGIGVYPMLFLTKQLQNATVYLGFRTKNLVTLETEFRQNAPYVTVMTDDGSYGRHGYALSALEEDYLQQKFDIIYACGPKPMLKAVKIFAEGHNIPCQLSLEERMGCGIGACLTCSCETHGEGSEKYKCVCKQGPVFWSKEVIL
ncbi:MAG: dihydroorotate dehydrogenase electron transfer subunit [Ruminococcaceae bacterium]|nr:dihydroorotate dehydrogenase electron transfer subunit [Oscillospiraceae bacterium]